MNKSKKTAYLASFIIVSFVTSFSQTPVYAQELILPLPGTMVTASPKFAPAIIRGIQFNAKNPFQFDFIIDRGDDKLSGEALKQESLKLIKYFLAGLTVPQKDLWVNLSPYEKGRIVPDGFGQTDMGRDLLAQDYLLKQLTASLVYPEKELGKKFWEKVYARAKEQFGSAQIPVNTFNKVWIVPDKAVVLERKGGVYVSQSHLKVMLEQDYLASQKNVKVARSQKGITTASDKAVSSQTIRDIILPEIEQEVNEGANFAALRQVFNSLILAIWYKKNLKDAVLNRVYANSNKINGIDIEDKDSKEKIYQQYLQAFKKGVYSYIKEDATPAGQSAARKYFSGGVNVENLVVETEKENQAMALTIAERSRNGDLAQISWLTQEVKNPRYRQNYTQARYTFLMSTKGYQESLGRKFALQLDANRGDGVLSYHQQLLQKAFSLDLKKQKEFLAAYKDYFKYNRYGMENSSIPRTSKNWWVRSPHSDTTRVSISLPMRPMNCWLWIILRLLPRQILTANSTGCSWKFPP